MKKIITIGVIIIAILFIGPQFIKYLIFGSFIIDYRPTPNVPTITDLPPFPSIIASILEEIGHRIRHGERGAGEQDAIINSIVNQKVSTYPEKSSRPYRIGKFDSTGIFGSFPPTEEQIAKIATHYDDILMGANKKDLLPRYKKYNPDLTFILYVDSGLNPLFANWKAQADAGSIDEEDLYWIIKNHPDWLLKDADGNFIRSAGDGIVDPESKPYWPDPGNPEVQKYFIEKISKLMRETGGEWDSVLLDDFPGSLEGSYDLWLRTNRPVKYKTTAEFQNAQIRFLEVLHGALKIPIIPNMDGFTITLFPDFFRRMAIAAGGAENEIFPEEMPVEDMRAFLNTVKSLPKDTQIRLSSKPSPRSIAGNIDRTLFDYYSYLLIASRDREIYWTFKEWGSDIPHYWYREFDLDIGEPEEEFQEVDRFFKRNFKNARVIVNPTADDLSYNFSGTFYNVLGETLESPIELAGRSAILLVKQKSILP